MKLKKPSKKVIIGVTAGAVLLIGGGIAFNVLKDDTNYYSVWKSVVDNDLGTFRYVVDVRSNPHDEEQVDMADGGASQEDLNDMESADGAEKETSGGETVESQQKIKEQTDTEQEGKTWDDIVGEKGKVSDSWSSATGADNGAWKYRNYQIVIEGNTNSTDPMESTFNITLVTENLNDKLTTVTILDDKMYVDLEQMRNWLHSSGDANFISIANKIPDNAKNMVIPLEDVKIPSPYAEDGEDENSAGVMDTYHKFSETVSYLIDSVHSSIGNKGLSKQDDRYSLNLKGGDAEGIVDFLIGAAKNRSSIFSSIVANLRGTISEEQQKAMMAEKDNFLAGTDEFYRTMMTGDFDDLGLEVVGTARQYEGGKGYDNIEATLQAGYTYNGIDYNITIDGSRTGSGSEIKVPDGAETSMSQDTFWEVYQDILDYLNFTNIDLSKQLLLTPDKISEDTLAEFVDLVNSTEATETKLTIETAPVFLEKYVGYEETAESSPSDVVNAQLANDFMDAINKLQVDGATGGSSSESEESIDQFRTVNSSVGDLGIIGIYNEEESTSKMGVIDITLMNNSDKEIEVNLADFSLQTALSSKYPCNNETTLHDYDNKFDTSKLESTVKVPANGFSQHKLYVVMTNGLEYMDLFYGNDKVGDIIAR